MLSKTKEAVKAALKKRHGYAFKEDGMLHIECWPDYRDQMQDTTAIEILESEDPDLALEEKLEEWYLDWIDQEKTETLDMLIDDLRENGSISEEEEEDVRDYAACELICVDLPFDHYLDQHFRVPVMLDTGDLNHDFSLNAQLYPTYPFIKRKIDENASIVWLVRQQGHTPEELEKQIDTVKYDPENVTFLASVEQELANLPSQLSCVTFLTKMTLRQLIEVNRLKKLSKPEGRTIYTPCDRPDCGTLVLERTTMCGLFGPFDGGGSILEIELEKDAEIPINLIWNCLPDAKHSAVNWTVDDVYGLTGKAWEYGGIKEIKGPERPEKEVK